MRVRKILYYVIDIDQFHAPNAKLKIRQYLILPDFRQNRQIFCTPIFLRLRYAHVWHIATLKVLFHGSGKFLKKSPKNQY